MIEGMDPLTAIDLPAAERFVATHARLLDRYRLACLLGGTDDDRMRLHTAVAAYANPDGGYGWGLEPDLRDRTSQPGPSLHAFEAWADAGRADTEAAAGLCDWLASIAVEGAAVPFGLPVDDRTGTAPFWADADPSEPSLQITACVVAQAHRVARIDPAVAAHPWLAAATTWCVDAALALDEEPAALVLGFAVNAVDGAPDPAPALAHLQQWIPGDGIIPVAGGAEGECLRPLDLAPRPDRPARALVSTEVIAADLARLAAQQGDDGAWPLEWDAYSPAAELEWRGHLTVNAIALLQANA